MREKQKLALLSQFPFLGNDQVSSPKEEILFNEHSPSAVAVLFCLPEKDFEVHSKLAYIAVKNRNVMRHFLGPLLKYPRKPEKQKTRALDKTRFSVFITSV